MSQTNLRRCIASAENLTYDRTLDLPNGRMSWKTTLMPVTDGFGRLRHVVGITRDITHEKLAEGMAEHDRALLQGLNAALPDIVFLFDVKRRSIRFISAADGKRQAWRQQAEDTGDNFLELFTHPDDVEKVEAYFRTLAQLREGEVAATDYRALYYDGSYRHFSTRAIVFSRDAEGAVQCTLGVSQDITDQTRMQEEVRDLSDRLLTLQIDERRRIAEELHDSTAQHLIAAGLALTRVTAEKATARGQVEHRRLIAAALEDAKVSLEEVAREIRVLSYLLHPPPLEGRRLDDAIRTLATGFAARAGLQLDLSIDGAAQDASEEIALPLFRICQEALANVHRHAHASKVVVRVEADDNSILLAIEDDGIGFDLGELDTGVEPGVDILGMRERMKRVGGSMRFASRGTGAIVIATAPCSPQSAS